jgi:hypothetical protein
MKTLHVFLLLAMALIGSACPSCSTVEELGSRCSVEGCPQGLVCDRNDLCARPCSARSKCESGEVCNAETATCVQCVADGDCNAVEGKPYCEASSGVCTSQPLSPKKWILGPVQGSMSSGSDVLNRLNRLVAEDIPITAYHFDAENWALPDKQCLFTGGEPLLARLRELRVLALLHFWGGCRTDDDFNRVHGQLQDTLGGFYLDHLADDDLGRVTTAWVRGHLPHGEVVLKAWGNTYSGPSPFSDELLSEIGHTAYVDDLPTDFEGLREGIRRVYEKTSVVAAFNEFTAFEGTQVEEETFFRRLHWGALQLVMDNSPAAVADPWSYSPALLESYRRYAWLHAELVPYLHSYDWRRYETGEPVLRQGDPTRFSHRLGDEIFAAFVVEAGVQNLDVHLPEGEWVDARDESRLLSGVITQAVPLGREPIFFRNGAIIPLDVRRPDWGHGSTASAGSLTVLVFPRGESSFRYRDDEQQRWITLSASRGEHSLTLRASASPSLPLLWRVARWDRAPGGVSVEGNTVTVLDGPGELPQASSAQEAEGATTSRWFYDAGARALIIKLVGAR